VSIRANDRESTITAILYKISTELDDAISTAPSEVSTEARQRIKEELIEYAGRVLDALSREEMRSGIALEKFVESVLLQATIRINERVREHRNTSLVGPK